MTLQEHYYAIKSGKGNKGQFLKQARNLFPEYFNQYTDFDTATNVLKSKQIISEAAGGVVSKGFDIFDWKKILAEEVKAEEKETSKEVLDAQSHAYDYKDTKNADNVNFNEIMKGFYAEMRDEKNAGKTGDEIKAMVVKNLAKDPLFYTKDGMFGEKGVGYTDEAPALGVPKEPKGKYKSSGYGDLKENILPEIEVDEAMDQGPVSIKGKTGPTGGSPKIPRALFLDKEVINTINDAQPGSIKLISKPGDKRVYMYVSSFVKNALDELERGRSSREKLKKQSKLADVLADKLPSAIRGKIKKEINPKMDSGLKMHYVDLNISPKKDKTGYWILAKGESAPLVTEEQKLRSVIREIIKESLNEGSIEINGKIVRTYTQNGDTSYNVTYDDGTKDKIYVNNDGWDEINQLHRNAIGDDAYRKQFNKESLISEKLNYKSALKDFEKKWLANPELKDKGIKYVEDAIQRAEGPTAKQDYGLLGMSDKDLQQYIKDLKQLMEKYS